MAMNLYGIEFWFDTILDVTNKLANRRSCLEYYTVAKRHIRLAYI